MSVKHDFVFLSNHLCLDFVNTEVFENGHVLDLIPDFEAFLNWLAAARAIEKNEADFYLESYMGKPEATEILKQGHEFRAAIRALAENLSSGGETEPKWNVMETVNAIYRNCHGVLQIEHLQDEFRETFVCETADLTRLLLPIAKSVSELLRTGNDSCIRRCSNPNCILFFYDTSKNHSRRWCSMDTCGNRVKVGAHYHRHRQSRP